MTKLSVNINKIATIRNARGGNYPDLIKMAVDCDKFGAEGITVHPRPDERHVRFKDVYELKPVLKTEFNIEGYPSSEFLNLVKSIKPAQVTLVPDAPDAITSNAGWDTVKNEKFLTEIIEELKSFGIRTSLFVDPNKDMIKAASNTGTDRVELYTEAYASAFIHNKDKAILPYIEASKCAYDIGIGLNAGHDLNLQNLKFFKQNVKGLLEVSIGHALISDALYFGIERTIKLYLEELK